MRVQALKDFTEQETQKLIKKDQILEVTRKYGKHLIQKKLVKEIGKPSIPQELVTNK